MPWTEFCESQAGITEASGRYYFECWEEVKLRVREVGLPDSEALLALMERVPSELTNQERQLMMYEIIRLGVNEDETQADLRRAYRRRPVKRETRKPALAEFRQQQQTEPAENDAGLLGRNMESLALGAGMNPQTASLARVTIGSGMEPSKALLRTLVRAYTNHLKRTEAGGKKLL